MSAAPPPPPATETDAASSSSKKKLFIGGLDIRTKEMHLKMLFKRHGEVEEVVIVRHTNGPQRGLPKGFAFVTMASQQDAEKARQALNGKRELGRSLSVGWAHAQSQFGNMTSTARGKAQSASLSTEDKIQLLEAKLKAMQEGTSEKKAPRKSDKAGGKVTGKSKSHSGAATKHAGHSKPY